MSTTGLEAWDVALKVGDVALITGADFAIRPGELRLIAGRSGSGKSSFLRALVMLIPVEAGTLRLDGVELGVADAVRLRTRVGFIPQIPRFRPGTVEDNLRLPLGFAFHRERTFSKEHAIKLLGEMDLDAEKTLRTAADEISGGEALRVSFARTLLLQPDYLLLDEPFAALDNESAGVISRVIVREVEAGRGIALASHQIPPGLGDSVKVHKLSGGRMSEG